MERMYWGIVSAGKICHDFVNALNDPTGPAAAHNKVVAVGARQLDRAKTFAEHHGISTVYGSYQEVADDENINIVYIGNTTGQHFEVCKMMLNAGKHVLCEKSLTTHYSASKELYDLASSKSLFLMEALWSNFFPTYMEIKNQLALETVGKVVHMEASFGLAISDVPRLNLRDLGGGASLDLGVYLVNLVRLVFEREEPIEIIARGDLYPTGVDSGWDAILVFSGNRRAVLKCSSKYKLSNTARLAGMQGCIELPDPFHCPTSIKLPNGDSYSFDLPDQPANAYNFENSAGLSYECAAASEAIRAGKLECEEYTPADSLYIAKILEEINKQIGSKMAD
ncbi:trans-1,2-dihydrobenzene-1,2-diol dehydrogenase-like [Watersipora subatra]|uniref:trans-1,2-dihydrobenzene-1,2-diol dehydrogenase-like n=1 Tax=Watersipora subatra TaxID=2589382 RepID=UPI00355C7DC1